MKIGDVYKHPTIGVAWKIIGKNRLVCIAGGNSGWHVGDTKDGHYDFNEQWDLIPSKNTNFTTLYNKLCGCE